LSRDCSSKLLGQASAGGVLFAIILVFKMQFF
jgi:hypothetical protein